MGASPQFDPELSELLQAWKYEPEPDPNLIARIWRRIETPGSAGDGSWSRLDRWAALLMRPLVAASALAACVVLGYVAAEVRHDGQRDDALARVAAEYVHSIDPVLMTAPRAGSQGP